MPGPIFLHGERVTLHTIEEEDVPFVHRLVNDPAVRRRLGMWEPHTEKSEREWVEKANKDGAAHFIVGAEGEPVGSVGVKPPNETWGVGEVGCYIDPDHWCNGYASDATRTLCRYLFEERRFHRVEATAYEHNTGSRATLEKVGFVEEGRLREKAFVEGRRVDIVQYGLLREELEEADSGQE
jgi:RimJ/RimL family protein N-acetyltransferase